MSQRMRIGAIAIGGVLVAILTIAFWALFLNNDNPAPVSLQDAVSSLSTPSGINSTGTTEPETNSNSIPTSTWKVEDGGDSFVGYRIGEELATVGTTEAVGRTASVTGTVIITGSIVEHAIFEADLRNLSSDDNRRDETLQDRGLESATYPMATFELTETIDLVDGATYSVVAIGDLTLHGVTRPVEIQMEAQFINDELAVIGSLEIQLADYNITPPTTRIALSIDDHGTVEMQLILSQSG